MLSSKPLYRDIKVNMQGRNPPEFFHHAADHTPAYHILKLHTIPDLNVVPDVEEEKEKTLGGDEKPQNNNTEKSKSIQGKTCKSDKADLCMLMVPETVNKVDWLKMTQPMAETIAKLPSSRQPKRGGQRTAISAALLERPEWLPEGWLFNPRIRMSGATAGIVDKYYVEPVSGRRFRSKKEVFHFLETGSVRKRKITTDDDAMPSESPGGHGQKKFGSRSENSADFFFDFKNPPEKVTWAFADASEQTWTPVLGDETVAGSSKREWAAVFSQLMQKVKTVAP